MNSRDELRLFDTLKKTSRSVKHAFSSSALLVCLLCALPNFTFAQESMLWESLRSDDALALMRHALAPGTGDPSDFNVNDCGTQRNLSDAGREQARQIGSRFRENGIVRAQVFSSQWCRCQETARLLELGHVQALSIINSFFRQNEYRETQTLALEKWIIDKNYDEPVVLVTHQVNITALTDIYPSSGEIVFIRRSDEGNLEVLGTIKTD